MGEVSNVSTTVSRKKKSAAVIEPKRQAASGKVRNYNKYNDIRELMGKDQWKIERKLNLDIEMSGSQIEFP